MIRPDNFDWAVLNTAPAFEIRFTWGEWEALDVDALAEDFVRDILKANPRTIAMLIGAKGYADALEATPLLGLARAALDAFMMMWRGETATHENVIEYLRGQ